MLRVAAVACPPPLSTSVTLIRMVNMKGRYATQEGPCVAFTGWPSKKERQLMGSEPSRMEKSGWVKDDLLQ